MAQQRRVRVTTYMKNLAKSFGYALGDTFSEYNPVIKSITQDTKETATEMYENIKSFAFDKGSIDEKSLKTQARNTIDDAWNNLKDDLKSGKWYNKERKAAAENDMAKLIGMDFDMDFDFDMDDWGDFDDDNSSDSTKAMIESNNNNAGQIINAVDDVGFRMATTVSNATAESASYIVSSNNRASKALYSLNERGFGSINRGLAGINDTIASFAQITGPLAAHMQNSTVFYANTTKSLNEINQSLQQIVKNTTPAPLASSGKSSSVAGTFSSLIDGDNMLNIDYYKNMIKDNFKDSKEMLSEAMAFLSKMKSEDGSIAKNFSPMQFATTWMTKFMLPKVFKESMTNFNESLKYAVSGGVLKMRDKSGGLVFELLKDLFVPKDGYKSTINVSRYNKGTVAWDGISRKALVEVIPTTLLKIYSAISGEPEMRYDYNSGKFITVRSIQKKVDEERRDYAKSAGGDFRKDALEQIKNNSNLNEAQKAQLNKEIEDYFYKAFTKGGSGFTDINKSNFKANDYGLSADSLKVLQELLQDYRTTDDRDKRNRHNKFFTQVQMQRDKYGNYMREQEATGDSIMVHLNNGSIRSNNAPGTDEFNHDMNFYLRGIYQYTGYLADNLEFIGGRSGKVRRRRKVSKIQRDIEEIAKPNESSGAGERTNRDANTSNQSQNINPENPFVDEDEARNKEHDERVDEAKKQAKGKFGQILGKVRGFFSSDNPKGLQAMYNRPFESVSLFLDKVGLSLDKLIWGEDNNVEGGIFGYIMKKTKDTFDSFTNWLDRKLGIKDKWNKVKDWVMDGGLREFKDETVDNLKRAGSSLGNTVKQFFGKKRVVRKRGANDIPTAAHGRKVTKSGIVAVSEGELIVPSELNPFYHGATNKSHQVNNERRLVGNFYGAFADGGEPIPESPKEGDIVESKDKNGKTLYFKIVNGKKKKISAKEADAERLKEKARKTKERLLEKYEFVEEEGKGRQFIRQGFETLGSGVTELFSRLFGKNDEESAKKDNIIIQTIMGKLMKEAGDNKGAMGAGALIGAGVSVATGAVVGPLFGAAIGAAAGLAANSKTVQKILFGADEKTGEINGGLFNKQISQFMMENVPGMAKGGALGGIAGLFMGSPILGAIVGATTGYVASSKNARTFLFGDENNDGKLIPKSLQEKIKKAAPNMAAGAIAGLALGPFGLVGNLLVGSGIGYLTTSEKFRDYMFGNGEKEGLVDIFKEKIFGNLDKIFHNMGNAITSWGKNLIKGTTERLKDFFTKRARAFKNSEKLGFLGKLGERTGDAIKGATNFVGNRLGNINSIIEAGNLKRGYGVYNREEGRNMFASERRDARGGSGEGTFGALDQVLANAGSIEELEQLKSQIEDARDPSRKFKRDRNTAMNKLFAALRNLDPKKATKIAKLVQKGDTKALEKIRSILTLEELQEYMPAINEALNSMNVAKNSKADSRAILQQLKSKGIDLNNQADLNNALDQIKYEMKNNKFSPEEQAKKEEKDWRERVLNIFRSMDINIASLAHGKAADSESTTEAQELVQENENNKDGNKNNTSIRDFLNNIDNARENSEGDTRTEFDAMGNPIQYRRNNQNEWERDNSDRETKSAEKRMNEIFEGFKSLPLIGPAIGGLTGLFGKMSEKLFGDGEEKKGLFGSLLDFLGGEDGPLKYITNLLTGSPLGATISNIASKVTLKSILANVVGPALFGAAITGKFDEAFSKITKGAYGDGSKGDITYDKNTGEQLTKDENGNWIDSNGNIVTNPSIGVRAGSVASFSGKLKDNTARGILTGTKSVGSVVLGKTAIGKGITSFVGKAKEVITSGDDIAGMATRMNFSATISDACKKFTSALKKIPGLSSVADKLDDMGVALANKMTNKLASESAENILKFASNAVIWAKIAFIVIDFTTGYEDARTTLGIIDEPTVPQKIISGLLRAIKNFIPIIGTLIPDSLVIDVFCQYIAPAFGIDASELMAQREKAQATVDEYNASHGTNFSVGEYNKSVLEDYTWTERIGNSAKSTWADTKNKFSNMKQGIQEKGLGGYLKDSISEMGSNFINSYKENGGGVSGIFSAMGDSFKNLLPGVFGEISKANMDIMSLASKGKLKELWQISLSDFQGGETNEEGITTAVPGLFSKIIGQIPLIVTKLNATPMALAQSLLNKIKESKIGKGITGFFDNIIQSGKNIIETVKTEYSYGEELLKNPDSKFSDYFKIQNIDEENPIGGIAKALIIGTRLSSIPVAIAKKLGNDTRNKFNSFKNLILSSINSVSSNNDKLFELAKQGKIAEMFSSDVEDNPDNPLNGIMGVINFTQKIANIPYAFGGLLGNKIRDSFKSMTEKTKSNYNSMNTAIDTIKQFAEEGDISSIWSHKLEIEKGDPLNFIWTAGFDISRLFQSAVVIFNNILKPVKELIGKAKETVNNVKEGIGNTVDNVKEKAGNALNSAKNWVSDKVDPAFQGLKGWLNSNSGGASGINKGFISQFDSRYKDMKLGNSTVSEKGCGPAVAAMISNEFGAGITMDQAIKYASKYQDKDGTKVSYFKDILGQNGIDAEYLPGKNISQEVISSLSQGKQVILLGQDKSNTSKSKSPFGPNNHYVIASGIDANGNIIVKDPESSSPKSYNSSFLKNATMGINANGSGGSANNSEIAQKVWGYFTSMGYSPAATAGIMANLQAESGMNPERFQDGGPAAGIAQWENYKTKSSRWAELNKFAQSKGYAWSELDPQLQFIHHELQGLNGYFGKDKNIEGYNVPATSYDQFKASTDPGIAAMQFEKAFERAGKPHMSKRLGYATDFYKQFHDSSFTGVYTPSDPSGIAVDDGSGISSTGNANGTSGGIGSIISAIGTAFSTALGKVFGDDSSSDSATSGSIMDTSTGSSGFSLTDDVAVDAITGPGNEKQKALAAKLLGIQGKLTYSMQGPRNPERGSADCSSTVNWAYKNVTGTDIGNDTGSILNNSNTEIIDIASNMDKSQGGQNSSGPNVSKLMPGDILLYSRPTSGYSQGRPYRVGHVEMYVGDGKRIGHGGGIGPKVTDISKDSSRYIMAKRLKGITDGADSELSAAGSGLISTRNYSDIARMSGGSSGLLMSARPGSKANANVNGMISIPNHKYSRNYSGGDSGLVAQTTSMLNSLKTKVENSGKSGTISSELVERLLNSIIKILETISTNTASVDKIYQVLSAYTQTSAAAQTAAVKATTSASQSTGNNEVDSNISNLVGTLAAIAKG